ncbi:MAG: outer membrane lipoprotein carrier protein LolA [Anaerohalosphaera sp.]|nr:outer membrane lipoprotein carrier protein LolA [Anaerohalosphaera sp.]
MRHVIIFCVLFTAVTPFCFAECAQQIEKDIVKSDKAPCQTQDGPVNTLLENILKKLNNRTKTLKTLEADVKFLTIRDPEMLDSKVLKKGKLYYKSEKNRSWIRIDFYTLKVDDEEEEKRVENIVFDGLWLTMVDHENETVNLYEQAPEKKPIGAFDFVNRNFPMVGFTKTADLKKEYEIKLLDSKKSDPNGLAHINLVPKIESRHEDEYKKIDIWVDKKTFFPTKMVTISTEDDVYDLVLTNLKVDKNIKNTVFVVETPKGFSKNIEKLKKQ